MRNLADTINRLNARRRFKPVQPPEGTDRLIDLGGFGSNPGNLRARIYIPEGLRESAPLVVVLHGCNQTAAGYDHASGWSKLADQFGFALLYPEQTRQKNPSHCLSWFLPSDIRRGSGEVASIAQMIDVVIDRHGLDKDRVFITGLSAGGAMTAAMLATYPEKFAAAAIIAGLPFGCATTIPEAFDRMRGHEMPSEAELRAMLKAASAHKGPWPRLSIWHGDADRTVDDLNADAIAAQWSAVLGPTELKSETIGRRKRSTWTDTSGRVVMEMNRIAGMGHGTPLDPRVDGSTPAPYMLDAGVSSTLEIAQFWGIADAAAFKRMEEPAASPKPSPKAAKASGPTSAKPLWQTIRTPAPGLDKAITDHVHKTIEDALRVAGLMR